MLPKLRPIHIAAHRLRELMAIIAAREFEDADWVDEDLADLTWVDEDLADLAEVDEDLADLTWVDEDLADLRLLG